MDGNFADIQELTLRQNSQNTADRNKHCKFFTVRTFDHRFTIFTVNVQDVFRTKFMLLNVCVQVCHSAGSLSLDIFSIT